MRYKAGDIIDHYRLEQLCGEGGFGIVFRAVDLESGQLVALKFLFDTGRHRDRELRGLHNFAEVEHPNLLKILHIGQVDDDYYYTMPLADPLSPEGDYQPDSLSNRLKQRKRLLPEEIFPLISSLLDGIEALHAAGLLHRDIKPDNILWIDGHPVLADMGLTAHEETASFAGTPGFIPVDMLNTGRNAVKSDDFFALGKVIYCAVTGKSATDYPSYPTSMSLPDYRRLIVTFLQACNPETPVATAAEFRELLWPSSQPSAEQPWFRRRWGIAVVALVTLVMVVGAVAVWQWKRGQEPPDELQTDDVTSAIIAYRPEDYNDILGWANEGIIWSTLAHHEPSPQEAALLQSLCRNRQPLSAADCAALSARRQQLMSQYSRTGTFSALPDDDVQHRLVHCVSFCDRVHTLVQNK